MSTEAATLATAADLAASTILAAPEPTATPPAAPTSAPERNAEKDSLGRAFDASKFRAEKDSLGRWKNLNYGGKKPAAKSPGVTSQGETSGAASQSYVAPDPAASVKPAAPDKFDLAADMYCRAFYATADSIFAGKGEWAPDDNAEHEGLRAAAAAYMRAKGMDDMPPGPALLLAVATYAAKRVQRPNTGTRFRMFIAGIRARFDTWRTGRKIEAAA